MTTDKSLPGEQVQVRVKKLELVGTETIMMHHSLLELMEQMTKLDLLHFLLDTPSPPRFPSPLDP